MEKFKDLKILFIRGKPTHAWHKGMKSAFSLCRKKGLNPDWISNEEIEDVPFSPTTVLVMVDFQSEVFKNLPEESFLIVGPDCLLACIEQEIPIPSNKSPVYNMAMKNVIVCTTKIAKSKKTNLERLVGYMGGCSSDRMTAAVTHIVAENVKSAKCEYAADKKIPIMNSTWVVEMWERTVLNPQLSAVDPDIISEFKLPALSGIEVTISNLGSSQRKIYSKMIEANGGIYNSSLVQGQTNYVVTDQRSSTKVKSAQVWGIPCVTANWLEESITAGGPLPCDEFLVKGEMKCSTPTSDLPSFCGTEEISIVPNASITSQPVDETVNTTRMSTQEVLKPPSIPPLAPSQRNKEILDELNPADISKAGAFLDGCKVFLSGWRQNENDKLKKMLIKAGAMVLTQLTEGVSHVIVGDFCANDAKLLDSLSTSPDVVNIEWMKASLQEKQPARTQPYLCIHNSNKPPPPSPLSSKGVQLLKSRGKTNSANDDSRPVSRNLFSRTNNTTEFLKPSAIEEGPNQITQKSSKEGGKASAESEKSKASEQRCTFTDQSSLNLQPFVGFTLTVLGFDSESTETTTQVIEALGGTVMSGNCVEVVDYAVVPLEGVTIKFSACEVVNPLWVEECRDEGKVVPIQYYHQPVALIAPGEVLTSSVVCLSGFSGRERLFLSQLAVLLGANVQEAFSKNDNTKRNILKCTHLIANEHSGSKYEAAIKWGVPVMNKEWLLELTKKGPPNSVSEISGPRDSIEIPVTPRAEIKNKPEVVEVTPAPSSTMNQSLKSSALFPSICSKKSTDDLSSPCSSLPKKPGLDDANQTPSHSLTQASLKSSAAFPSFDEHLTIRRPKRSLQNAEGSERSFKITKPGPSTPLTPFANCPSSVKSPFHVVTPDTPYGQVFKDNPSPDTRKKWKKYIDSFPDITPSPLPVRRKSTPVSVLKKQILAQIGCVDVEGIEKGTGKILKNGPYAEWAHDSSSESSCQVTPQGSREIAAGSSGTSKQINADEKNSARKDVKALRSLMSELQKNNEEEDYSGDSAVDEKIIDRLSLKKTERNVLNHPLNKLRPTMNTSFEAERPANEVPYSEDYEELPAAVAGDPIGVVCETEETQKMDEEPSPTPVINKIFMLSSLSSEAKDKYEGIIRSLGGEVSSVSNIYEESATHLVIEKPVRNEKLLCSIASGKWVLHVSYLDRCYEAREFLSEEEYEWGNPQSDSNLPRLEVGSQMDDLARAAYRWRRKCTNLNQRAFRSMKVYLFVREQVKQMFLRLLEAGHATIVSEPLNANLCLVEEGKVELPEELPRLVAKGIPCVPPVFLSVFLSKHPLPSPKDHLIQAYKK